MDHWYTDYRPSRPREVSAGEGIKARSKRGPMSASWWSARWVEALEQVMDPGRLSRGRNYARSGQVVSLEPSKRGFAAQVQGSRPKPYKVTIELDHLKPETWENVLVALTEDAIYLAELLAGQMPSEIDAAFASAGARLFPQSTDELDLDCSCPDGSLVCKHIAAVFYLIGERLDDDPFLLFHMRGKNREAVLAALRAHQGEEAAAADDAASVVAPPLAELADDFWRAGQGLERFETTVQAPTVMMPMLRRLGPASFAGVDLEASLAAGYEAMTREALAWAAE